MGRAARLFLDESTDQKTFGARWDRILLEFFANVATTDAPDSLHPAPSYRAALLVGELDHLRYLVDETPVTGELKTLEPAVQRSAQVAIEKYDPASIVAHKTIEGYRSEILGKIRGICTPFSYRAEKFRVEVPKLVGQLKKGLLPAEPYSVGKQPQAMSAVAILNAGWELYKTDRKAFLALFAPTLTTAQRVLNMNRLLFKALETSEVVRVYFS